MVDPARLTTLAGLEQLYKLPGDPDRSLFPVATVRTWIAGDVDRFASTCVVRLGGKVLIDLDAVPVWLESRRGVISKRLQRPEAPAEPSGGRLIVPVKAFDEVWRKAGLAGKPPGGRRGRRRAPSTSGSSA